MGGSTTGSYFLAFLPLRLRPLINSQWCLPGGPKRSEVIFVDISVEFTICGRTSVATTNGIATTSLGLLKFLLES